MNKTITIGKNKYRLSTNAYTPILYAKTFNKDYFQELLGLAKAIDENGKEEGNQTALQLEQLDILFLYRLFYVFHKSSNPKIAPFDEFFENMPYFPLEEVGNVVMELVKQSMVTRKKKM